MSDRELLMVRPSLKQLPQYELPAGFTIRPYQPGDEAVWCAIHEPADPYNQYSVALFEKQFGTDEATLTKRQRYLLAPDGTPIGTTTAWQGEFEGEPAGQVHWVAILPQWHGQGLAKPLLSHIMDCFVRFGDELAYLETDNRRIPAVNLYLSFGFTPAIQSDAHLAAWWQIAAQLKYPVNLPTY